MLCVSSYRAVTQLNTMRAELQSYKPFQQNPVTFRNQVLNPQFPDFDDMPFNNTASIHTGYGAQQNYRDTPATHGARPTGNSPHPSGVYSAPGTFNSASNGGNQCYPDAPIFSGDPSSTIDYEG
jgi:hypothetical protein